MPMRGWFEFDPSVPFVETSTPSFINFPPLEGAGGQILAIKWDWEGILVLWEPSVQTFG